MSIARRWLEVSERFCLLVGLISILWTSASVRAQSYALVDLTLVPGEVSSEFAVDLNDDHIVHHA